MSSYDADYKFPGGPLEAFYGHGFQPPKKGEGAGANGRRTKSKPTVNFCP